jgi:hypothetical protein
MTALEIAHWSGIRVFVTKAESWSRASLLSDVKVTGGGSIGPIPYCLKSPVIGNFPQPTF